MIILAANNICKTYGTDVIIKDISFHINEGDRVGIIGANGAGKTTLLNIIGGDLAYDEGDIFKSQGIEIGYLRQSQQFDTENTLYQEVMSIFQHLIDAEADMETMSRDIADRSEKGEDVEELLYLYDEKHLDFEKNDGYGYKSKITGILNSMAFGEEFYDKKIAMLSGGEKTRLALACLLLKKPRMLLLDEPTNHLDIGTLRWLEQYLKGYSGTIVLISHDRYFLDQTVNRIFEIEHHKLYQYNCGYKLYADQKRQRREDEMRQYKQQQKEIAKQEEIIRRFKQHGTEKLAKRAASREKKLSHIERIDKPEAGPGKMKIAFKESVKTGNDVLLGIDLSKGFGYGQNRRELFDKVNFDIKKGEKICIVGPNGVGKTTLLKIIMGVLDADKGHLKVGHNVEFGYYDQGQELLEYSNTILEEMKESYRLYSDTEMRSILGRFLFKNEGVFLSVSSLSGGEKARLSLLKLMLSGANVLIMDEPTNHLDIDSKEVFEDALSEFPGTVIVVSHDRYFLNRIPNRIFELSTDGIIPYLGSYDYYMEKREEIESGKKYLNELAVNTGLRNDARDGDNPLDGESAHCQGKELSVNEKRLLNKELEAEMRRKERLQKKLEEEIHSLEEEIKNIEGEMCLDTNSADHVLLAQLESKYIVARKELEEKYDKWLETQE